MSVEVALGTILGIAGTVVGVYATHYFEERREYRRMKVEEWKMVVDEVYSPMIFDFMRFRKGTLLTVKAIGKTLAESSGKFPLEEIAASITLIAQFQKPQSKMLEDILKKKSRLIKPSDLWLDLYLFYSYIEEIEGDFSIISTDHFKGMPNQLLKVVQSCVKMGETLEDAASHLTVEVGKLVVSTTGMQQSLSYKPFFTKEVIAKMEEKHESVLRVLGIPPSETHSNREESNVERK